MTETRHWGRRRPGGEGTAIAAYAARYQNDLLADHVRDEDRKIGAAQAHSWDNLALPVAEPPPSDLPAHLQDRAVSPRWRDGDDPVERLVRPVSRRPRESMSVAAISGEAALGRPAPRVTSTRLRDSDEDDED
jgi:hypothetical protein